MIRILFAFALVVSLSACQSSVLGTHGAPDELAVIEGPALSLPPDYDLRPPLEEDDLATKRVEGAKRVVFGEVEKPKAKAGNTDAWLLENAGAEDFDPAIRKKLVAAEKVEVKERKKGWLTRKKEELFGGDKDAEAKAE